MQKKKTTSNKKQSTKKNKSIRKIEDRVQVKVTMDIKGGPEKEKEIKAELLKKMDEYVKLFEAKGNIGVFMVVDCGDKYNTVISHINMDKFKFVDSFLKTVESGIKE